MSYQAVVIGVSTGGVTALKTIFSKLPEDFPVPVLVVQHVGRNSDNYLAAYLDKECRLDVMEAEDKIVPKPGRVYVAPANYHLLVELTGDLALALLPKVNFSRPSVDVLFESAAEAYLDGVIGVVLTGANGDGTAGLERIKSLGGVAVVQDPATAEAPQMPESAIEKVEVDHILPLDEIGTFLNNFLRNR